MGKGLANVRRKCKKISVEKFGWNVELHLHLQMPTKKALRKLIKKHKLTIEFLSERLENEKEEKTILIEKPNSIRAKDIKHSHHMEKVFEEALTIQTVT